MYNFLLWPCQCSIVLFFLVVLDPNLYTIITIFMQLYQWHILMINMESCLEIIIKMVKVVIWEHQILPFYFSYVSWKPFRCRRHLMIHTMEEGTMRSSYLKRLAMWYKITWCIVYNKCSYQIFESARIYDKFS